MTPSSSSERVGLARERRREASCSTRSAASTSRTRAVARIDRRGSRGAACRARARRSGPPSRRRSARRRRRRRSASVPRASGSGSASAASNAPSRPPAHDERALERLHLGRVLAPLVVAEVRVARAAGDDQRVVGDRRRRRHVADRPQCTSRASRSKSVTSAITTRTLRSPLEDRAQRISDLARRQRARRDLVGERLEEVEVPPVDQRHLDRRAAQRLRPPAGRRSRRRSRPRDESSPEDRARPAQAVGGNVPPRGRRCPDALPSRVVPVLVRRARSPGRARARLRRTAGRAVAQRAASASGPRGHR